MWGWERMLIAEAEPLWGQDLCSQDPGQRPTQDGFGRPAVIEGVGALGDTWRLGALREGAGAERAGHAAMPRRPALAPAAWRGRGRSAAVPPRARQPCSGSSQNPESPPHRGGCAGTAQGTGPPRQEPPARLGNAAQRPAREPGRVPRDRTPRDRHGIRSPERSLATRCALGPAPHCPRHSVPLQAQGDCGCREHHPRPPPALSSPGRWLRRLAQSL